MINDQFFQNAINDNKTKSAILNNYKELVTEEKKLHRNRGKSLALRANAAVNFLSRAIPINDKKYDGMNDKNVVESESGESIEGERGDGAKAHSERDSNAPDEHMDFVDSSIEINKQKTESMVKAKRVTKVEELLRKSQVNALQMNKDDLDKMYNLELGG